MTDHQAQIQKLVADFVKKVTAVARAAALEQLTAALGGTRPDRAPSRRTRRGA